jgi:DnaJ-class molecular chaperone
MTPLAHTDDRKVREYAKKMGLDATFTREQLRDSYLRGCRKLNPDKKGGDTQRFLALQEAYSYLKRHVHRPEVDLNRPIQERAEPGALVAAPAKGRRHKDVNSAYAALHGDGGPSLRGHGDWLKSEIPDDQRPPDRINHSRLNETFEKIAHARGRGPLAVSTHVVQPVCAHTSVGYDIEDSSDDFTIGNLADLQRAFGGAL